MLYSSKYSGACEYSMTTSAHRKDLRKIEYTDLLTGILVLGVSLGFCLTVWYAIIKLLIN